MSAMRSLSRTEVVAYRYDLWCRDGDVTVDLKEVAGRDWMLKVKDNVNYARPMSSNGLCKDSYLLDLTIVNRKLN